jgi:hypothetical protein
MGGNWAFGSEPGQPASRTKVTEKRLVVLSRGRAGCSGAFYAHANNAPKVPERFGQTGGHPVLFAAPQLEAIG